MTPQEKAIELVYKYKDAPFNCVGCDMPYCDIPCTMLNIYESKQCALIAIDEIIKYLNDILIPKTFIKYWQEVKQEIEKL